MQPVFEIQELAISADSGICILVAADKYELMHMAYIAERLPDQTLWLFGNVVDEISLHLSRDGTDPISSRYMPRVFDACRRLRKAEVPYRLALEEVGSRLPEGRHREILRAALDEAYLEPVSDAARYGGEQEGMQLDLELAGLLNELRLPHERAVHYAEFFSR